MKFSLTISMIFITAVSFAQSGSQWTNNKIIVDGSAYDWNPPLKHYDNQTALFFDIKNDSNNLYLCFQTKDEMNEAKILRSGMKVILSDKINGKHKSVINFPLPFKHVAKANQSDEIKPDPLASRQSWHASLLAADTLMEVKGFTNNNGIISINNSDIRAAINVDSSNTLTYEIAIPFKELFGNDYNLKDVSKDISLNVIINAMSDHSEGGGGGYAGRGGRGGGRMGGGYGAMQHEGNRMGGEGGGQYQYDPAAMLQKTELKQKFALSFPQ
ncbi:MAG TPA: hypothetical protein VN722_08595 [Hanamia sp.]|nr:hypothetical protein [Hanamia sp.]